MEKKFLFVLVFIFFVASGYGFVESYTLEDSPLEEVLQCEPYFVKKDFSSVSGLYHWGDVLNGKIRYSLSWLFGELGYSQIFSIPMYNYSGDIEDFASAGSYYLGIGFVWNSKIFSFGARAKLSELHLLEVNSLGLSFDFFGKFNFQNYFYAFSFKNLLGLRGSLPRTLRDIYLSSLPMVFDNSFVYYFRKNLKLLGGLKVVLYHEFDYSFALGDFRYTFLYPQVDFRIGATYSFATNMNLTFINTFKYGNYLNLSVFYESVIFKDIGFVIRLSYSYVNFIEGGLEVFLKGVNFLKL